MARIRTIKPEAFQSESLAAVSVEAERTFYGLTTQVDDRSRIIHKPVQINATLWAYRPAHTPDDLARELEQLTGEGLVCVYVGCDGREYLHLPTWDEHQRIDRPSRSRLPLCPVHNVNLATSEDDYCGRHEGACKPATPRHTLASPREPSIQDRGPRTVDRGPGESPDGDSPPRDDDDDRPDVEALCQHLADQVEANGSKRPTVTKRWRTSARLLLDADGRTPDQVRAAIDWCQADTFWRSVILSMPKLREKYDQIRLSASRGASPGAYVAPRSTTDERVSAALDLAAKYAAEEAVPTLPAIGA